MKNPSEKKYGEGPENVIQKIARRRRKVENRTNTPLTHDESNWLVSYADMMTLLFGFFVLLYSFSRVDEKKFEIVRKDVARYFGGQIKINPTVKKLEDEIKDVISASGIDKKTQVVARDSELELRFNGSLHFIPGTAKLDETSNFLLSKLIDTVKRGIKADSVSVEGHTDDSPISSEAFPSNWELSSARASTVVREFEKFGFDSPKLTAKGYGSSRPLVPNRDSKGAVIPENQESNRRVIVTIAFRQNMDDAVNAMKTGDFVSADTPENFGKDPLIHVGEGEPTWNEKMAREISSAREKLKLAEERLRDADEKARAAKSLAEMQGRLKQVEKQIKNSEKETQKFLGITEANKAARYPASGNPKRSQTPPKQQ
ncbi:MAG: OmpA family protein [Bdellovibrionales bacterium]|nr:OmpA family protein [Bdellovibrionales bacterium]